MNQDILISTNHEGRIQLLDTNAKEAQHFQRPFFPPLGFSFTYDTCTFYQT